MFVGQHHVSRRHQLRAAAIRWRRRALPIHIHRRHPIITAPDIHRADVHGVVMRSVAVAVTSLALDVALTDAKDGQIQAQLDELSNGHY